MHRSLISVGVITYNSAAFIEETLDSILAQDYQDLELVIADDCSTDDTVEVCRNWLLENDRYFAKTKLLIADQNKGSSANCNLVVSHCGNEWIKLIAGDDALEKNALVNYAQYIRDHPEALAVHASSSVYENTFEEKNFVKIKDITAEEFNNPNTTAEKQFKLLLQGCYVNTPTILLHNSLFKKFGFFDTSIRNLEDWPMWIKLSKNGVIFHALPKVTVKYRIHRTSQTNVSSNIQMFNRHQLAELQVYSKYIIPELKGLRKVLENMEHNRINLLLSLGFTKRNLAARIINYFTFAPLNWLRNIVKKNEAKGI